MLQASARVSKAPVAYSMEANNVPFSEQQEFSIARGATWSRLTEVWILCGTTRQAEGLDHWWNDQRDESGDLSSFMSQIRGCTVIL